MTALGHKRTNHPEDKPRRCPLLSKSGQKPAKLICTLSAKSGLLRCNMIGETLNRARQATITSTRRLDVPA
jgi:hypothetical protein